MGSGERQPGHTYAVSVHGVRLGTQGPGHTDAASQVEVAILVLLVPRDKQRKGGVRRKGRFRAVSAMQMRSEHIEAVQAVHLLGHPS